MTSSLFATTVIVSFFVVAIPHVLPCPAPRVSFADGELSDASGRRRRRRRPGPADAKDGETTDDDAGISMRTKRECPVPKPGGVVGELLGFKQANPAAKPSSSGN
jgi:cytochrome c oxidase assembly factor 2